MNKTSHPCPLDIHAVLITQRVHVAKNKQTNKKLFFPILVEFSSNHGSPLRKITAQGKQTRGSQVPRVTPRAPKSVILYYEVLVQKGKMLSVVGKCHVCVSLPPVNMPSVELNNSSHYKEVIFPSKKLRAGHWRKGKWECAWWWGKIREDTEFQSAWPTEQSQLWGQPDREARISVYRCTKLMAMKRILHRHKSTLVFRLMYPECKLFSPLSERMLASGTGWALLVLFFKVFACRNELTTCALIHRRTLCLTSQDTNSQSRLKLMKTERQARVHTGWTWHASPGKGWSRLCWAPASSFHLLHSISVTCC